MSNGLFQFESCLLKHHIRTEAWLPTCRARLRAMQKGRSAKHQRRLRYFTFCAVGAIDVLMLDVAKIIRRSADGRFDTVVFFDMTQENIVETQKNIPGAIGFPGDFINLVLMPDPEGEALLDGKTGLEPPEDQDDELEVRGLLRQHSQRRLFITHFPFDVINLDLEEFLFKPTEELPGKVINVMRKVFEWQKRPSMSGPTKGETIDDFSLMFTTQIGPPELSDNYLNMLENKLKSNIEQDPGLRPLLITRAGHDDLQKLRKEQFELFFKLSMPKMLASILMDEDWYVDPDTGIKVFEFERNPKAGCTYHILHVVMDVKRKHPPKHRRPPMEDSPVAASAYKSVVNDIFTKAPIVVADAVINKASLLQNLDYILARRKKYLAGE